MRTIDRVTVTKGAIFDYEEIVCFLPCDVLALRHYVETTITKLKDEQKTEELRIKYYDKSSDKSLLLFIKKGYSFGIMQMWILQGICEESDYDKRMETNGTIKEWLEVEIE